MADARGTGCDLVECIRWLPVPGQVCALGAGAINPASLARLLRNIRGWRVPDRVTPDRGVFCMDHGLVVMRLVPLQEADHGSQIQC